MNAKDFTIAFVGAVSSNIFMTDVLAIRNEDGTLAQDPYQRQILPITLGVGALFYGLQTDDQELKSRSLGFALGMAVVQATRYLFDCYDVQHDNCMRHKSLFL